MFLGLRYKKELLLRRKNNNLTGYDTGTTIIRP